MVKGHRYVKNVDVGQRKRGVNTQLRMSESILIGNFIIAFSARRNNFLNERKLLHVFALEVQ